TAAGIASSTLDLARPPMLLYVERDGVWQLAGVEYALPSPPRPNPLPGAEWHRHEASCHYRDYREAPAPRAADCPTKHPESNEPFVLWHPAFAVAHVWAWIPSPDGPFSEENRALAPYGGMPRAPGHPHPRSETELAYSQVTHRVAGALRRAGALARSYWYAVVPTLGILAGASLFVHFHDGRFHVDAIYLQHAAMGLTSIAAGALIFAGRRTVGGEMLIRWGWPGFIGAMGLILLFYVEH